MRVEYTIKVQSRQSAKAELAHIERNGGTGYFYKDHGQWIVVCTG